jgi:deoxycytidine triphosphate deaminase
MYKIIPLTLKKRVEISVGAVVSLEVNEKVEVPHDNLVEIWNNKGYNYATLHIRKSIAQKGVLQCVSTPFPEGYSDYPTIVVKNNHVAPIELLEGEEVASVWIFTE